MPTTIEDLRTRPGALVTVAYLKALLDEGNDHLGIFIPLIIDVITQFNGSFIASEIQEALATRHGIAMPIQTMTTLLQRLIKKKILLRDAGRYQRNPNQALPQINVASGKSQIEAEQRRLGRALQLYSEKFGITIETEDAALEMLLSFLDEEQVGMLIEGTPKLSETRSGGQRERNAIAAFICDCVYQDPTLAKILREMLEGLVLYHAAFLPDMSRITHRFKDLLVIFDSNIVRQALGYEGTAMQTLVRESVDVLKANGVQCLVLDKTIQEIQRILAMFEVRLATSEGRRSLRADPMSRHFLTQQYSVSDVREMSALLKIEVRSSGFQIMQTPTHVHKYTSGEKALAARLADPTKKDEFEPRVFHDVDCVAATITLRKGHRSSSLDDAKAIFATSSPRVILNTRLWWEEDEHETGVPPVVHIRALTNIAWLKKPSLAVNLKVQELVALCSVALRPSQRTWRRFLRHLDRLQESNRLNSDEVTAILVSSMSDRLLRDAELENDTSKDIDATSLDEVVERVREGYAAKAEDRVRTITEDYENKLAASQAREREAIARADTVDRESAERARKQALVMEGRARSWARGLSYILQWGVAIFIVTGAVALIVMHPFHSGPFGIFIGLSVVVFVLLELAGVLRHVGETRAQIEIALTKRFRKWLEGKTNPA